MQVFVINLDSRPDRWAKIKERFRGFDIERIPAVVKPVGAHGNFLSMIKAIKLAKKRGLDEVLILEDDCLPVPGFKKRWAKVKAWLDANPDKWDIYSGGAHKILLAQLIGHQGNIEFYDPVWSVAAHWIYIQSRSYDILLDHYTKYNFGTAYLPALGVNVHNNLFKTVISSPFLAYQDSGYSNIKGLKRNTRKLFRNSERELSLKN
jgi:hypothetical protein